MSSGAKEEKLKFEEALAQIEQIIDSLEAGELSLEESLSKFQAGIELIKICHEQLEQVEQKIEMVVNSTAGGVVLREAKVSEEGVCL